MVKIIREQFKISSFMASSRKLDKTDIVNIGKRTAEHNKEKMSSFSCLALSLDEGL
jgi:hypothetical protein